MTCSPIDVDAQTRCRDGRNGRDANCPAIHGFLIARSTGARLSGSVRGTGGAPLAAAPRCATRGWPLLRERPAGDPIDDDFGASRRAARVGRRARGGASVDNFDVHHHPGGADRGSSAGRRGPAGADYATRVAMMEENHVDFAVARRDRRYPGDGIELRTRRSNDTAAAYPDAAIRVASLIAAGIVEAAARRGVAGPAGAIKHERGWKPSVGTTVSRAWRSIIST